MRSIIRAAAYLVCLALYSLIGAVIHFSYLPWVPLAACILGALIISNSIMAWDSLRRLNEPPRSKEI